MSIYHYWGKSRRGETDGGDDYHLLCWHSLDVAAVGYWMVINNIYFIDHYLKKLGIQDKEQAAQFLPGFYVGMILENLHIPSSNYTVMRL